MERRVRILRRTALALFLTGGAVGFFGTEHAVAQRFPEGVPDGQDTDWIGVEWIAAAMGLWALAVTALVASIVLQVVVGRRARARGAADESPRRAA